MRPKVLTKTLLALGALTILNSFAMHILSGLFFSGISIPSEDIFIISVMQFIPNIILFIVSFRMKSKSTQLASSVFDGCLAVSWSVMLVFYSCVNFYTWSCLPESPLVGVFFIFSIPFAGWLSLIVYYLCWLSCRQKYAVARQWFQFHLSTILIMFLCLSGSILLAMNLYADHFLFWYIVLNAILSVFCLGYNLEYVMLRKLRTKQ